MSLASILRRFAVGGFVATLLTVSAGAQQVTVYNGSGVNPIGFQNVSGPNIGQDWVTTVMATVPPSTAVFVTAGGTLPPGSLVLPFGEVLVFPPFLHIDMAGGQHAIPIPNDPLLIGQSFFAQALTIDDWNSNPHWPTPPTFLLHNALECVVGP